MDPAATQQQQQQQPAEPEAFSQFPAPPGFYRLYEAGPDAGPPPPLPLKGQILALGETFDTVREEARQPLPWWLGHTTQRHACAVLPPKPPSLVLVAQDAPFVPPLDVPQLYTLQPDNTVGEQGLGAKVPSAAPRARVCPSLPSVPPCPS